jgi:hypothetical protein
MVNPKEQHNEKIAAAIAQRLQVQARASVEAGEVDHLDSDMIVAFVEGRVPEPGATSITSHLLVCSICRRASAKAIHLESVVLETLETDVPIESSGSLREFIDNLASRMLPESEDDVVFAYEDRSSGTPSSDEPGEQSPPSEKHDDKPDSQVSPGREKPKC